MPDSEYTCGVCGQPTHPERCIYHDKLAGIPNLFLHGVEIANCSHCGNRDTIIPCPVRVQTATGLAILRSPRRLSGPQLRFIRKHTGLGVDEFSHYLSADPAQLTKWERDEAPIPPEFDRLSRLLAVTLAEDLAPYTGLLSSLNCRTS